MALLGIGLLIVWPISAAILADRFFREVLLPTNVFSTDPVGLLRRRARIMGWVWLGAVGAGALALWLLA